ncbi:hypothetical protein [Streptomyces fructofermentans]|uniref:hypothetical protein n=1 Tax=Streptomyces fructofermentans TaxID=152141 RepID=UPI0037B154EA
MAGVQIWQVSITADGRPVGSLRAARGLWWKAVELRERLTDEGHFLAEVAQQLMEPDGSFTSDFDELVREPDRLLILDRCRMTPPWDDALTVAAVVTAVVDRLTDHHFVVVLPRGGASDNAGTRLLEQAGRVLDAVEFTDRLLVADTSTGPFEAAACRVRDRLIDRFRHGGVDRDDLAEEDWLENSEYRELTPRTAALLRLSLEQLSTEAWREAAALGDEPLPHGTGGLFGSLPPVTLREDGAWRRRMARAFDDLAEDLDRGHAVPHCQGEEAALHLGIRRAQSIHRNRPRLLARAEERLPAAARDYDWHACADLLFDERHDVQRLFTLTAPPQSAGDSGNDTDSSDTADAAHLDWFAAFDKDRTRDPARGHRRP